MKFSALSDGKFVNLYLLGKKSYSAFFQIFHYLKKKKKVPLNLFENCEIPNFTENSILSNFDLHIRPSKSDIFSVTTVVN